MRSTYLHMLIPKNSKVSVQYLCNITEAQIVKGRFHSDGIKVFLSDNLTLYTDLLVIKVIGGIKLKALSYQTTEALHSLNAMRRQSPNARNAIACPKCRSLYVELFSTLKDLRSFYRFLYGVVFSCVPFSTRHKYKCEMCDTEFDLT